MKALSRVDSESLVDEEAIEDVLQLVKMRSVTMKDVVMRLEDDYVRDLAEFIEDMRLRLSGGHVLTDEELEDLVLKIPMYLFYAAGGLEMLGMEGDTAQATKKEVYNSLFLETKGTVEDKTKTAELGTFTEQFLDAAYGRAYKTLKLQIEMAEHLATSAKKIMSKRMLDTQQQLAEKGFRRFGGTDE